MRAAGCLFQSEAEANMRKRYEPSSSDSVSLDGDSVLVLLTLGQISYHRTSVLAYKGTNCQVLP